MRWDTHFFSKYRDIEHVLTFDAVNTQQQECDVNYSQKLMSKSLKLEEVTIYRQVYNTRGGGVLFFFYKT